MKLTKILKFKKILFILNTVIVTYMSVPSLRETAVTCILPVLLSVQSVLVIVIHYNLCHSCIRDNHFVFRRIKIVYLLRWKSNLVNFYAQYRKGRPVYPQMLVHVVAVFWIFYGRIFASFSILGTRILTFSHNVLNLLSVYY